MSEAAAAGPIVQIDAGGSLVKAHVSPAERGFRLGKAELIASSLVLSGVDAVAVGSEDWKLGTAELRDLITRTKLPVLAANLQCGGERPYPASVVVERGGKRIGIVGITVGVVAGCDVLQPRGALVEALDGLGEVDVRVALIPTDEAETTRIIGEGLPVDLIFDASPGRMDTAPDLVGGAWAFGTGPRGQRVGLTELTWFPGASGWWPVGADEQARAEIDRVQRRIDGLDRRLAMVQGTAAERIQQQKATATRDLELAQARAAEVATQGEGHHQSSTRHVELDTKLADHAETLALVSAFKHEHASEVPAGEVPLVGIAGSGWAGADACASCHDVEFVQWKTTGHARAWQALVKDESHTNPDCFSCHATGAGLSGGPTAPATVGGMRDVQCEACHGPSAQHLADPAAIRPVRSPPVAVCQRCHDGDRDGGRFDPAVYLPKVQHLPAHPVNGGQAP